MNGRFNNTRNSTVMWMCAIVFLLFSFLWLYGFQADVLAAVQHVMSGGRTQYKPLFGAVLITGLLQMLQLLVSSVFRLTNRGHALTYFPSLLCLALISVVNTDIAQSYSWGLWWLLVLLALAAWAGICLVVRYIQNVEPDRSATVLFSRPMWINMLVLLLMMVGVAWVSNTNAVFHYRMRAETCLLKGDYAGALDVGSKSLESDADLQMIRMYAMARRGELGDRLFHYPVAVGSRVMLPTSGESHFVRYPVDSLYHVFGARPARPMLPTTYLKVLSNQRDVIRDYTLCGLLIDRQLDDFVEKLQLYYAADDSINTSLLPKHYREALMLYNHLRRHPKLHYRESVMEEDYNNLQELEKTYLDETERQVKVEDVYGDTYWYYYKYGRR